MAIKKDLRVVSFLNCLIKILIFGGPDLDLLLLFKVCQFLAERWSGKF